MLTYSYLVVTYSDHFVERVVEMAINISAAMITQA